MALVLKEEIDKIEIVQVMTTPHVQVRKKRWVEDDVTGEKFGQAEFERHILPPDADVTEEEEVVRNVAAQVHTPAAKAAYQAKRAAEFVPKNSPNV